MAEGGAARDADTSFFVDEIAREQDIETVAPEAAFCEARARRSAPYLEHPGELETSLRFEGGEQR